MIGYETGFVSPSEFEEFMQKQMWIYRTILGDDITPLQQKAIIALQGLMRQYIDYKPFRLAMPVYEGKLRTLLTLTKKKDLQEALKPSISQFDGHGWRPKTRYHRDDEELLYIAALGTMAPLRSEYVDRLEELTERFFK